MITQHLGDTCPDDVWAAMRDTWAARSRLKLAAGVELRGRDNRAPVLHYTLSWHKDDNPTPEHMQKVALESLLALGLGGHQAVIAAHTDKEHLHVHVVANTVNPENGRTADLKFSKLHFSRWAEAYEREHGIHCEERIRNNEERRLVAQHRAKEASEILMARDKAITLPEPAPYLPIKHKPVQRAAWFDKKDITDRMKRLRAEMDLHHKVERNATWQRQKKERDALDANTKAAVDNVRQHMADKYRGTWRELYKVQKREMKHVERIATHPLERAVYVYSQRDRLGRGSPLTLRQMVPLITNHGKLLDAVDRVHARERRNVAQMQKVEQKTYTDRIMANHVKAFETLKARQTVERQIERDGHYQKTRAVTFQVAKTSLAHEHVRAVAVEIAAPMPTFRRASAPEQALAPKVQTPPRIAPKVVPAFEKAAAPPPAPAVQSAFEKAAMPAHSRAEQIKREMEAWRKRNQDRDFGREL